MSNFIIKTAINETSVDKKHNDIKSLDLSPITPPVQNVLTKHQCS